MKEFYRRHLPHWQPDNAVFFVTFRLKNSLPYKVIATLREARERETILRAQFPELEQVQQNFPQQRGYFDHWEDILNHAEFNPRWLSQPEIAEMVKEAMYYRDGTVFTLHAFCIMSNHVHAVFEPINKSNCRSDLSKIMQSLKRHTARRANIILGREGAFWQDESYDHVIRDSEEYARIIKYVLENPVKAGLVPKWDEWPWTYCKPGIIS